MVCHGRLDAAIARAGGPLRDASIRKPTRISRSSARRATRPSTANEAIQRRDRDALDRLRASVAATPRRRPLGATLRTISSSASAEWIAGLAPPQLALAAAVAALLVMLQAAAIGALVMERAGAPAYQTAGGEQTTEKSFELLVGLRRHGHHRRDRRAAQAARRGSDRRTDGRTLSSALARYRRGRLARPRSRRCVSRGW